MSPQDMPPIGERIREERVRQGWSVRRLATEIGVSASLISQIETGKSQPSVSTLYAITTALRMSIEDLFASPDEASAVSLDSLEVVAGSATAAVARGARRSFGPDRMRCIGPVVHPDDREALTLETGVSWELLGQVPGVHVDFLRVTYPPGSSSSTSGGLMRHGGTEYGFLMAGELVLTLAFDEHHLAAGDAISFASSTPHGYRNDGAEPAVGIWFVIEAPDL